jgi:carboxyl-terminal processing protease
MALITAVLSSTAYLAGFATQRLSELEARAAPPAQQSGAESLGVFWEAWDIVNREFYGPLPDSNAMIYGAIRGAIRTLGDPHTAFANPTEARRFAEDLNGRFEGIGATVEKRDDQIVIVAPLPNTPAERAGLRSGDVILKVDGESISGTDLWEAITRIRGPRGTDVTLTIQRVGRPDPFDVIVQRDRIDIPTVESRLIEESDLRIAYVKLFSFSNDAPDELRRELRRLLRDYPRGVILDLRDNPGGYLHVAVEIASEFIDDGLILTERGRDGGERPHYARPDGLLAGNGALPLVVLVNRGSASASEIVAGAIQDHQRGILIGETTFGKGSVQVNRDLSDGSNLRVTTAHWFTPNGRQIHESGLEPDIPVRQTDEQIAAGVDLQLEQAVQHLVEMINRN